MFNKELYSDSLTVKPPIKRIKLRRFIGLIGNHDYQIRREESDIPQYVVVEPRSDEILIVSMVKRTYSDML